MTTQHAKSNAREGDGVGAVVAEMRLDAGDESSSPYLLVDARKVRDWADRLESLAALQAQQGAEPVAWVAFNAEGKPTDLAWWEDSVRRRMSEGGSVSPLIVPATGAPR